MITRCSTADFPLRLRVATVLAIVPILSTACPTESNPPLPFSLDLSFPLVERDRFTVVVGVDHDPEDHSDETFGGAYCTDFASRPFPHCYDGHTGTDYLLIGDFGDMDRHPSPIIAAADGVVGSTEDGHYDKCHIDGLDISCDGHPIIANHVIIEHEEGYQTRYWHLRTNSVSVSVGDVVSCGTPIGEVGSSGISSKPHLHFGLEDSQGRVIDPYAGAESQEQSYWFNQGPLDTLPGDGCAASSR